MKFDTANMGWVELHELMAGAVVPRPIALVSTVSRDGVYNVAPFSFFSVVAIKPTYIGFNTGWKPDGRKKDTLVNIEFARDFVINVVTEPLAEQMLQASRNYPSNVSEFKETGLTPVKADLIRSPMVAESPVNMECRLVRILEFGDAPRRASFIIGEIVRIHVKDELCENNVIDTRKLKPIARMGAELYCRTTDIFEMKRAEPLA